MSFAGYLKQSTAVTIMLGPFVDEDDGKTAETGLTISQADVRLSKNGGNMAQKNESSACTHDEIGIYACDLDDTDTGDLGLLDVMVHESGALPVKQTYLVVKPHWYNTMFSNDYLQVDVIQIEGSDATDQIRDSVVDDATRLDASSLNAIEAKVDTVDGNVDAILVDTAEIGAAGAGLSAVPWNAAWDAEVESEVDDALGGGTGTALTAIPWNAAWDAEVQSECADALAAYDPPTKAELDTAVADVSVDEIQASALADLFNTDSGTDYESAVAGSVVAEIADNAGGSALTEAGIADAVWNEALGDHDTEDTVGNVLNDLTEESSGTYRFTSAALATAPTGGAGSGAITFTYTLTSSVDSSPIADASVWVTTDLAGSNVVASGTTDVSGQVVFYLDAATYYVWRQKAGWNFTNPDTEVVS